MGSILGLIKTSSLSNLYGAKLNERANSAITAKIIKRACFQGVPAKKYIKNPVMTIIPKVPTSGCKNKSALIRPITAKKAINVVEKFFFAFSVFADSQEAK